MSTSAEPVPPTLFVAHPGHELRLVGWLSRTRPRVHVLTDGSGSHGTPRLESTRRVLDQTGCAEGALFGLITDAELYSAMMQGETRRLEEMTIMLSESLRASKSVLLVTDAWEFYNPAHDLCRAMAWLAVERTRILFDHHVRLLDYDTVDERSGKEAVTVVLDGPEYARKLAIARSYAELDAEVTTRIENGDIDLGHEKLFNVTEFMAPFRPPLYEAFGAERVAAGRYPSILTYHGQFLPFIQRLSERIVPVAVTRPA
jgi:hypothetical protein